MGLIQSSSHGEQADELEVGDGELFQMQAVLQLITAFVLKAASIALNPGYSALRGCR